jgi:hypothetical protein
MLVAGKGGFSCLWVLEARAIDFLGFRARSSVAGVSRLLGGGIRKSFGLCYVRTGSCIHLLTAELALTCLTRTMLLFPLFADFRRCLVNGVPLGETVWLRCT